MDTHNHVLKNADLLATSLHFWWVAFLRSSRDFWWICQEQGKCLDQRLVKVWEDFGDLYKYPNFSQWWIAKGTKLFDSPQIEMELFKHLSSGIELLVTADLKRAKPGMICLAIPLNIKVSTANEILTKLFETARLRETLRQRCQVPDPQRWQREVLQKHKASIPNKRAQSLHRP